MGPLSERESGILLHPTSLPSEYGIGDFGPKAYRFVELLAEAGQGCWQLLPLNPTSPECGNSPYISSSGFALNPLLISPDLLAADGLLEKGVLDAIMVPETDRIQYRSVHSAKLEILKRAYKEFSKERGDFSGDYESFCDRNAYWLDDYAAFTALKEESGLPWHRWPEGLRKRMPEELEPTKKRLEGAEFHRFVQYIAYRQWWRLKEHCKREGIRVFGDLPFYVSHDSADVWANPELFKLDGDGRPLFVSGVPPDYFSKTGQLWGHPVYDWERLRETGFEWWMRRIDHNLEMFDLVRIDHFRGLLAYWEVPGTEKTAMNGRWVKAPSEEFFETLRRRFPSLPFVAEDLGVITEDVKAAIKDLGIPGMKVLIFAFDGKPDNPYLPENHEANSVSYTGTHDTNTVRGWFKEEATQEVKENLFRYLGRRVGEDEISTEMVRLAMGSRSRLCIVPMQDVLNLGSEARLNVPSSPLNNYLWKMTGDLLGKGRLAEFAQITRESGRSRMP
ncbi:MAG: 4-alpha-glucanotransferase (amylomaltase) [Candidatus Methanosuratincola subterraneus]|uniref:4-alpha-glucanotransferase n=1 Tax=Methanosuratincola subterraneus TaxID=2593994 RepID=A0A444L5M5_METS7|nr:MAG: 4-alpha-glucanotransferase (amylomaltase) [Candidatus Methanosuratincola subterraneus]